MLRRFSMLQHADHLFRDMVGNHVEDGRWKMEDGQYEVEHVAHHRLSTLELRPSTQSSLLPQRPRPSLGLGVGLRVSSISLAALLFLSSSPVAMAITMGQLRSGSLPMAGGGRGSAPNLQNAGAESAQRTAELARQSQQKSEEALNAMEKFQKTARGTALAGTQIKNGLSVDFLHPHDGIHEGAPRTTSWRGASIDMTKTTALGAPGDHHVEVKQSEQNAYLYWKNFNVGPRTTMKFDQSAGGAEKSKWIAFNKITGTASPTSIYGKIKADGQVYILNQNGILAHNGAEVNVHSLVASTLPINGNLSGDYDPRVSTSLHLEGRGIANNPDYQFLFSALEMKPAAAIPGSGRFVPRVDTIEKETALMAGNGAWIDEKGALKSVSGDPLEGKAVFGNVEVERGAQVTVGGANASSGLLLLAAPNVINQGIISAPQGQVILASGLQVGLAPHDANDPSLRGLDVTIGKVLAQLANPGIAVTPVLPGLMSPLGRDYGTAWQGGLILAPRGNFTMAGADVSHQGVTMATTSVTLNGRIDLLANYGAELNPDYDEDGSKGEPVLRKSAGLVRVGSFTDSFSVTRPSLIAVLPDWNSSELIEGSQLAINSLVSVMAGNISLGRNAMIWAPGATSSRFSAGQTLSQTGEILTKGVTLSAGSWQDYGKTTLDPKDRSPFFLHNVGSIHLAEGSVIDVAGSTGIKVDGAQNYLKVQLRGPELANSPLQRESPIRGKDITVDSRISGDDDGQYWVGTPLGDVTGYLGLIRRSVGELTIDGGTIGMAAGESISLGRNSLLNVSGGWKEFSGGSFKQTMILYRNQLIPVWQATPDRIYGGIAPFDYKITEKAYFEGGDGGSISLQAASMGLDGQFRGLTVVGERQLRLAPDFLTSRPPSRSGLEVHVLAQKYDPRATVDGVSGTKYALNVSPYAPTIRFESGRGESLPGFDIAGFLPSSRQQLILLNPSAINGSGFGRLFVENHDGRVVLPVGSVLDLRVRGSLAIEASKIDIAGSIITPAGSISLTASTLPYDLLQQYKLPDSKRPDLSALALYNHSDLGIVLGFGDASALPGVPEETITIYNSEGLMDGIGREVALKDLALTDAGSISLRAGCNIDVSGLGIDDFFSLQQVPLVAIAGGNVTMKARQLELSKGRIDVSGGYHTPLASNRVRYADAGSIFLHSVSDPDLVTLRGGMNLGAKLSGFAGFSPISPSGKPGLLDIKAPAIRISPNAQNAKGILGLSPTFFDQGGFGTFRLSGIGLPGGSDGNPTAPGVEVTGNTVIHPTIMRYRAERRRGELMQTDYLPGGDMGHAASLFLSSEGIFDENLAEGRKFQFRGVVRLGEGSAITLDPKVHSDGADPVASLGQIWINMSEDGTAESRNSVTAILGDLTARGGSIRIGGSDRFPEVQSLSPKVSVDLGSGSQIRVDGTALYLPDPKGLRKRYGIMADAGEILVRGAIAGRQGSLLSANGSSALFDDLGSVATRRLDGSGGNIVLKGGDLLFIDSRLSAVSGGITGLGGSLKISSARFISPLSPGLPQVNDPNNPLSDADTIGMRLSMRIFASGSALGTEFAAASDTSILGRVSQGNGGIAEKGGGAIATTRFSKGGFDQLELSGNLLIEDGVSLRSGSILRVATGGILSATSRVTLDAPYVSVGMAFEPPLNPQSDAEKFRNETAVFGNVLKSEYYAPPVWGEGKVIVNASRGVDLGNMSFQRVGSVQITTPGVIRGNGTMAVAGDLTMKAAQIEAVSDTSFRSIAFDYAQADGSVVESSTAGPSSPGVARGSITILANGNAPKPLSAGGSLSLYSRELTIGGSLVAPFGTINLGNDGSISSIDPVSGVRAPYTEILKIDQASRISVSGAGLDINYGTSSDGTIWRAPSSKDITAEGTPGKSIRLMGGDVAMLGDLDLSGGGRLSAIRWISGLGGKINLLGSPTGEWSRIAKYAAGDLVWYDGHTWSARSDSEAVKPEVGLYWTRLPESYAIIPNYQGSVSPTGYGEGLLGVGSQVWLRPGQGFAGGSYVLLPSAYATQPGSYLLTVESSRRTTQLPISFKQDDGSLLTTGSYYKPFSPPSRIPGDTMLFSIASSGLVSRMADYRRLDANTFFTERSVAEGNLPRDAGVLSLQSGAKLSLAGHVAGLASSKGFGARVDVSVKDAALRIGGNSSPIPGSVWINPNLLANASTGSWTFGSILLGGTRSEVTGGRSLLTVTASSITIADGIGINAPDVVLASRGGIDIGEGVAISTGPVKRSVIDKEIAVSGNGSLIRVSTDETLALVRSGGSGPDSDSPGITIRESDPFKMTSLLGMGILLDSTSLNSSLAKDLVLGSEGNASSSEPIGSISINSGLLNLIGSDFNNRDVEGSSLFAISGAVLSGDLMQSLQGVKNLRLQSYGDLNLYGSTLSMNPGTDSEGMFGDARMSLTIGAPSIQGRGQDGGSFAFRAADVHIGNPLQGVASGDSLSPDGILEINASRIFTGSDDFTIRGFSVVSLLALDALVAEGSKKGTDLPSLSAGDESAGSTHLYVSTPMITGSSGAGLMMRSSGDLILQQTGIPLSGSTVQPGLAASIAIDGNSVSVGTKIFLPSGSFSATARGDLQVGSEIDVSGSIAGNSEVPKALPGGTISLESTGGIINLAGGTVLKMDAREGARAGSLSVAAVAPPDPDLGFEGGNFLIDSTATISAKSGAGGSRNLGGVLRMDLAAIPSTSRLAGDDSDGNPRAFSEMGFTREQSFRARSGDMVLDDPGFIKAASVTMTADQGSITVQSGSGIDASGTTGGSIALQSSGSLVLQPNSYLTVHGDRFDASGAGGSILLSAGISIIRDGVFSYDSEARINLLGSYLDLGITESPSRPDQHGGTLHIRVPRLGGGDPSLHDLAIADLGLDLTLDPEGTVFRDDGTPSYTSVRVTVDPSQFTSFQDAENALGRSFADIAAVNGLTSDGLLIGSTLNVGAGRQHAVLATDSVASLALRYQVAGESIRSDNDLLAGTGLKIGAELRSHTGASAVIVEGYQAYDLASGESAGVINATGWDLREIVRSDAEAFFGVAGSDSEGISGIRDRILSHGTSRLAELLVMSPGIEVVNTTQSGQVSENSGATDLSLKQQLTGSDSSVRNAGDWDFSQFRVGAKKAPGFLSLRAAGDILLESSLSDGFQGSHNSDLLSAYNSVLPGSFQSWSYSLVAGADFSTVSDGAFVKGSSSEIGLGSRTRSPFIYPGLDQKTSDAIAGGFGDTRYYNYQVIRTGTGSIDLSSSGRINLRNNLASIYTAGVIDSDQSLSGRFDLPSPNLSVGQTARGILGVQQQGNPYRPQFSQSGGSISLEAGTDILRTSVDINGVEIADSTRQLPSHWLYRRGSVDADTGKFEQLSLNEVASTSWWVDFSNFFQGVGALGGGNITLSAGKNIENVDAVVPTMMRMMGRGLLNDGSAGELVQADKAPVIETGGGNLMIKTGGDLSGGTYYVERGEAQLRIGGGIISNATRDPSGFGVITGNDPSKPLVFLPTTFFAGKGVISVEALADSTIGPVANPFLTPQGINNGYGYRTYFSTYDDSSGLDVSVLSGNLTFRSMMTTPKIGGDVVSSLWWWMKLMSGTSDSPGERTSYYQPWTRLSEDDLPDQLQSQMLLLPSKVSLISLSGDIRMAGDLILNPAPVGSLNFYAKGSVIGMNPIGYSQALGNDPQSPAPPDIWYSSTINVSDAAPKYLPSAATPFSFRSLLSGNAKNDEAEYFSGKSATKGLKVASLASTIALPLSESGSYTGEYGSLARQLRLHDKGFISTRSGDPIRISADGGGISGLRLFTPKRTVLEAAKDIDDVALYLQNVAPSDQSIIRAGGSVNLWSQASASQREAREEQKLAIENGYSGELVPTQSGDVRMSGPGSLLIVAGGSIDLGNGAYNPSDGTGDGITSIGNSRNPNLPFAGADIDLIAGMANLNHSRVSELFSLASGSPLAQFYFNQVLKTLSQGGLTDWRSRSQTLGSFTAIRDSGETTSFKEKIAVTLFQTMLKQAGRDYNDSKAADYKTYRMGEKAVETLLGSDGISGGNITTWSRDIRTKNGGSISITAPGGGLTLANTAASIIPIEPFSKKGSPSGGSAQALPPGIVTAAGGAINIFTDKSVNLGIGRIFTLRGGDIMIWSDRGDIAAGASAKTVASAPPTRVLIDPQSASVLTDLAGLATGGGIGVLAAIPGVPVGNVDLIAPTGVIDAGDAGIRSTGNLNLAATKILNADNILAGGVTVGAPPPAAPTAAPPAAAPPAAPPAGATAAAAAGNSAAENTGGKNSRNDQAEGAPSIISVEVLGYGGGDGEDEEKKAANAAVAPVQASL